MTRDVLTRMDVDVSFLSHKKIRRLQMRAPTAWPLYTIAWLALLGDSWKCKDRVPLIDAWQPVFGGQEIYEEAKAALAEVGLIDKQEKIPPDSWDEWVGPALARIQHRSAMGRVGARARWGEMRPHSEGTADGMHHANHANHAKPADVLEKKKTSSKKKSEPVPVAEVLGTLGDRLRANGFDPDKV